ncbi:hypothetical protein [Spiroplasma endosymbiont of Othius punctulatus]|uniref:hypothetical protein n=1 Tax=Spiroplasma endosymbiont of Othius punctulatus TaxID=3066289 RepID=UPI0030D29197
MKNWWLGVKAEFGSRIGSSKKRIVKFIGILFVPILYAVVCILAFWNPIPGIGKAPTAFLNTEHRVYVATNMELDDLFGEGKEVAAGSTGLMPKLGILSENGTDIINADIITEIPKDFQIYENKSFTKSDVKYIYKANTWDVIERTMLVKTGDNKYQAAKAISDEEILFSNITKFDGEEAESNFKNPDYYLQMKLENNLLANLLTKFGLALTGDVFNKIDLVPVKMWTTFENNFIFGYYLKTLDQFKSAIPSMILEKGIDSIDLNISSGTILVGELEKLKTIVQGIPIIGATLESLVDKAIAKVNAIGEIVEADINNIVKELVRDVVNIFGLGGKSGDIVDVEIQGLTNSGGDMIAIYGIGLGEFFILIGMFVGTLMQTFIYDRAKRVHKLNSVQWYLSKTMLMWVTGMLQVTLLVLAVTAAGWHIIGALAIFELWLWLMILETAFVVTIQAVWFSLKDETIGKFIIVVYMVLNLASGWGTFPSFMQFGFFNVVSYITEFRYGLHGMTSIIYSGGGNATFILEQFGILLAFIAFFLTLGMLVSRNRNKEMYFGSYQGKKVYSCLIDLNKAELAEQFRTPTKSNKFKYNWKSLGDKPMFDLVEAVRKKYPFEGQFKKFKEKEKDVVLKPNQSDDEVISRNDDTLA